MPFCLEVVVAVEHGLNYRNAERFMLAWVGVGERSVLGGVPESEST